MKMENKTVILLRLSDYLVAVLIGSLCATVVYLAVSSSWSMPAAMLAGMALATVVMIAVILPFALVGGIFEIVMPGMCIAMMVGMAGGMWVAAINPSAVELIGFGFMAGFCVQAIFHLYDRSLHGEIMQTEQEREN